MMRAKHRGPETPTGPFRGALVGAITASLISLLAIGSPVTVGADTASAPLVKSPTDKRDIAELRFAPPHVAKRPTLFKDGRGELALALAQGKKDVLLVVATMSGRADSVAKRVKDIGGEIRYRDDNVDYLRIRLSLKAAGVLMNDPEVISADLSIEPKVLAYDVVAPGAPIINGIPARKFVPPAPAKRTGGRAANCPPPQSPLTHPYSPLASMGADEFVIAHPHSDGRGVVIALLDGTPDLLVPELQTATAANGLPERKFAGIVNVTDPDDEPNGAPAWVTMEAFGSIDGKHATYKNIRYELPTKGTFRIGLLDESDFKRELGQDVNRDGNPPGSSRLFAVLWKLGTDKVWVDTNQNQHFDDEQAVVEYSAGGTIGVFGADRLSTPVRESTGFAIQIDSRHQRIAVNIGRAKHATNIAGAAVGHRGPNGRFDGVAPGAQLFSVNIGQSAYGLIEGAIRAAESPLVDMLVIEGRTTLDDTYNSRDGRLVATIILGRLVARYHKPIFVPASNTPALTAISGIGQAVGIVSVGGQQSKSNFRINRGIYAEHEDNLHHASSFGPAGDGALKPDVLAPTDLLSTTIGFIPTRPFGPEGCFRLPPGYGLTNGTSTAAPVAAAAAALLVSAAKQHGLHHDAARVERALTMSARYVPYLPAHEQGNGVINVASAWKLLQSMEKAGPPPAITAQAPVRTPFAHLLQTPGKGRGLFEIDGWAVGDRGERTVTLRRTSGSAGAKAYAVHLQGNDGTYTAPASIRLPLNVPIELPIGIAPETPGVHSAILTLDDAAVPGHVYRTLLTVVTPRSLDAAHGYTYKETVPLLAADQANRYIRLPPHADALKVDIRAPKGDFVVNIKTPDGRYRGWAASVQSGATSFVIPRPPPGVWELLIRRGRNSGSIAAARGASQPTVSVGLQLKAFGAASTTHSKCRPLPAGNTQVVCISNAMAKIPHSFQVADGIRTTPLGAVRDIHRAISAGEQQVHEIHVPDGSTELYVRLRSLQAGNRLVDLDLYAFDCTSGTCHAAQADARIGSSEALRIPAPAKGLWKVVVDGFETGAKEASYDYKDVIFNPAFGELRFSANTGKGRDGWTVPTCAAIAPAHLGMRRPYAHMTVYRKGKENTSFVVSHLNHHDLTNMPCAISSAGHGNHPGTP